MPIYEYYCSKCHAIYSFRTGFDNTNEPNCPDCNNDQLTREVSRFAISRGRAEREENSMPDLNETDLEKVLASFEHEAEHVDQDCPRDMARLMRKMFDATGMKLGDHMEEAIARMESGEDPNDIESDLGDLLDDDASMFTEKETGRRLELNELRRRVKPPRVDPGLYDL